MNAQTYRYLHLDVFTDSVLEGNQLAVFTDARGLDARVMQKIALEMAFSETTFVLPPENSSADFRVRIFTPRQELPMAGHPTIGTTFALSTDNLIEVGRPTISLGLGIGPTPVALEWNSKRLHFAWMTQPLPEFGLELTNVSEMAAALGIQETDIRNTGLPIQVVSCGLPFLFVPLASRGTVDATELDRNALRHFCATAGIDELPVFVFSLKPPAAVETVFSRMFAPGFGVAEDPATGGASGALGSYLLAHHAVSANQAHHMISLQGAKIGRPSRIHISIEERDGGISRVRVGGQAVVVGEGTIVLPS
jgi:trans-2,3-dihydro-3-hydroxyanthranilate isomerase